TLIDQELEKAKAVIVLWSPKSVTSDWVLGEAQTARDMNKLIPIKISDCKLPLPYRALHTPEIYKTKTELDQLAKLLSEKFRQNERASPSRAQDPKIEFSEKSSATFFGKLLNQHRAYRTELGELRKNLAWYNPLTWVIYLWGSARLDFKYLKLNLIKAVLFYA